MLNPVDFAYQASVEGSVTYGKGDDQWSMDLFDNKGSFEYYVKHGQEDIGFDWEADWDGQDAMPVHYSADYDGEWYKLWKDDGSATGFYIAELKCPHSYYDDDHYCAIEFRCYLDDSDPNDPTAFSYTLHDDC